MPRVRQYRVDDSGGRAVDEIEPFTGIALSQLVAHWFQVLHHTRIQLAGQGSEHADVRWHLRACETARTAAPRRLHRPSNRIVQWSLSAAATTGESRVPTVSIELAGLADAELSVAEGSLRRARRRCAWCGSMLAIRRCSGGWPLSRRGVTIDRIAHPGCTDVQVPGHAHRADHSRAAVRWCASITASADASPAGSRVNCTADASARNSR